MEQENHATPASYSDLPAIATFLAERFDALGLSHSLGDMNTEATLAPLISRACITRRGEKISTFASAETLDVPYLANDAVVLRIPFLLQTESNKDELQDVISLVIGRKSQKHHFSSVMIDVLEGDADKRSLLESLGFELFSSWFAAPVSSFSEPAPARKMQAADSVHAAELIALLRKEREEERPEIWTPSESLFYDHITYLRQVIRNPKNICMVTISEDEQLNAFAVGIPGSITYPFDVMPSAPLSLGDSIRIDDFQVTNRENIEEELYGLLSAMRPEAERLHFLNFELVCSAYNPHISAALTALGAKPITHWYIRALAA